MVITSAGCDWLTATAIAGTEQAQALMDMGECLLDEQVRSGYDEHEGGPGHGYSARRTEGVLFGWRSSDVILQLSGEMAQGYAATAARLARNISRVDVQVTIDLGADAWAEYARACADDLEKNGRKGRGRRWNGKPRGHLMMGIPHGDTLYIGAKSSDRRIRIYDKGVE